MERQPSFAVVLEEDDFVDSKIAALIVGCLLLAYFVEVDQYFVVVVVVVRLEFENSLFLMVPLATPSYLYCSYR